MTATSEYLEVDPAELIIGTNVRLDRRLDKEFLASIEELGVLQPIVGYRDDKGRIVVRYGSRRTVAAVETGRPSVPVVVGESPDDVERIATQVAENEARKSLTTSETVAAVEQLAAFDLSASAIVRKTGLRRTAVTTALKVAGSELATKAAGRYDLTLDQAAAVQEFDGDPEAVKALVAAVKVKQFEHVRQQLRDDRAEAELFAALRTRLAEEGTALIERSDMAWPAQRLDNLKIEVDEHKTCDGHAAYISTAWSSTENGPVPVVVYVCVDAVANGHRDERAEMAGEPGEKAPMTDDQKAERKRVIALNKAWTSATTVRREWLATFVRRKTAPAGAELFVLTALLMSDHEIKQAIEARWPMLCEILGVPVTEGTPAWIAGGEQCKALSESLSGANAKRVLVVLVAAVLLAWETKTGPHTWRRNDEQTRRYLQQLSTWGYTLSDVERIACGEHLEEDSESAA